MESRCAITLCNARIGAMLSTLRIAGSKIVALGAHPQPDDLIIDLRGDRVLPGLINGHDHLQLNGFARQKHRDRYDNVRDWIVDVARCKASSPSLGAVSMGSRDERLLLGGIKNLLSGVTTVAHHDPLYEYLRRDDFPTQVVTDYGWSHSLFIEGEQRVRASYRQTPISQPWIIHAAEGVDDEAYQEFERLDRLGCIGSNTLIVHGVAFDRAQRMRLAAAGAGLIWCPASNLHLFGRTAEVGDLVARGRVALGSDSRLSGGRDLLSELRVAREATGLSEETLEDLVTAAAARLLHLVGRGVIEVGAAADIAVLPPQLPLSMTTRADWRLVMIAGRMRYGDRDYSQFFSPASQWSDIIVDGRQKALDRRVAVSFVRAGLIEAGLEVSPLEWRAA